MECRSGGHSVTKKFSLNRHTGPIQSLSGDVRPCVCRCHFFCVFYNVLIFPFTKIKSPIDILQKIFLMEKLRKDISASISIGKEIQCLPYEGFFTDSVLLGQASHRVACRSQCLNVWMCECFSVVLSKWNLFQGLSSALKLHYQFPGLSLH